MNWRNGTSMSLKFRLRAFTLSAFTLGVFTLGLWSESAAASPRKAAQTYQCPLCSGLARAIGHDGKSAPRRYSDLEVPTRAYTNLVVACPKCGYAAWTGDFSRRPSHQAADYTQRRLKKTAKRAATDPLYAYQHLLNLLYVKRASLTEQVGAALFYTYVLKRRRPYGGMNPALERRIVKARSRVLKLLALAMKRESPSSERVKLEWRYILGELKRLVGDPKGALPHLKAVCWKRKVAGYSVGKLACEMADRASRGETWEDYRDGVSDVRQIPTAEAQAKKIAEQTKKEAAAAQKAKKEAEKKALEAVRSVRKKAPNTEHRPTAPPPTKGKDPYAPAPPPVAR